MMIGLILSEPAYFAPVLSKIGGTLGIYIEGGCDQATGACAIAFLIIVGLIGLIIWSSVSESNKKAKRMAEARAAYQQSLTNLKSDPTNASLRQRTLELGRVYSNLTRNNKGVTIFDEVALSNDINAACAGATFNPQQQKRSEPARPTTEERLAKLADLKSKGLIDEQEYGSSRQKILDEI